MSDIEKMAAEAFCHCVSGLTYILFFAGFTSDTINEIGAFAADVVFCRVDHARC